jgi:hypothetical protein
MRRTHNNDDWASAFVLASGGMGRNPMTTGPASPQERRACLSSNLSAAGAVYPGPTLVLSATPY